MTDKPLKVLDFTPYPGPRYIKLGSGSGEEFRDSYLIPAINAEGESLQVDLDGVAGYGSSFLEEAFGGLIRKGVDPQTVEHIVNNGLISEEDPSLLTEIREYVIEAIEKKRKEA